MAEVSTATADVSKVVWWGTRDDLKRLIGLIQDIHDQVRENDRRNLAEAEVEARKSADDQVVRVATQIATLIRASGGDAAPFAAPEELAKAASYLHEVSVPYEISSPMDSKFQMTVKSKTWNTTKTGDPVLLIESMDESEVVSIDLGFRSISHKSLDLKVRIDKTGSTVFLSGPQAQVASAAGQLEVELKRQSSKLGVIHKFQFQLASSAVAMVTLSIVLFSGSRNATSGNIVAVSSFIFLVLYLLISLISACFPRFELLKRESLGLRGR